MEFSTAAAAASGSHMIMQGFNPNAELFGFPGANTNPNPNPNNPTPHGLQDHWHAIEEGFPGNPSNTQGLSLSLSNPMITSPHQEQLFMSMHNPNMNTSPFVLRRSKYLIPAQVLLNEFCNLGGIDNRNIESLKKKEKSSQWEEGGPSNPLLSMDLVELQRRKARLLSMLEEVHRRYRRYCEQMRAVVSSFEAVAGEGAAAAYSALASKAMSRHFRCLKDGITSELGATKAAMGEKDAVAPGTTKGETPRLKKLEQCLRQQKAFLQAGIMESQPWRPQRGLPERSVSVLRAWLFEHFLHPYPSDVDKHILARQTGLSRSQVSNWFINARVRLWKPMVEEMYMEELKDEDSSNLNPSSSHPHADEHKPIIHEHGLFNDSDSLSSIVNNHHHSNGEDHDINNPNPNPNTNSNPNFGVIDLDFSSYNGGGVSLTLGLQQQDRGPMSLSFSPASQQSLFFNRQNIVNDNQAGQFSILDEEGQNLPYRNLMGAQLLHDLAG